MSLSFKQKLLRSFSNPVYDTITVAQASARYGVAPSTVTNAVSELRREGFPIYTNRKTLEDGRTIRVYRLGTPSKRFNRAARKGDVTGMVEALTVSA